jgi:hypothetical protein
MLNFEILEYRRAARKSASYERSIAVTSWRRREGVEPSGDLTIPRLVLKTLSTRYYSLNAPKNPNNLKL